MNCLKRAKIVCLTILVSLFTVTEVKPMLGPILRILVVGGVVGFAVGAVSCGACIGGAYITKKVLEPHKKYCKRHHRRARYAAVE